MKNFFTVLLSSLFLTACQTHLPIISDHIASDEVNNQPCVSNTDKTKPAGFDYLLYVNRMVDSMIEDDTVQQRISSKRLKILIKTINNTDNAIKIDMLSVNSAVKNRLLRSGQFIVVNHSQAADVQLSGVFEKKQKQAIHCIKNIEQFSLQLKDSHSKQLIWSDIKQFE